MINAESSLQTLHFDLFLTLTFLSEFKIVLLPPKMIDNKTTNKLKFDSWLTKLYIAQKIHPNKDMD